MTVVFLTMQVSVHPVLQGKVLLVIKTRCPKLIDSKTRKDIDKISPNKGLMARWLNSKQRLPSK